MARPKKPRTVKRPPIFTKFKPVGIPGELLDHILLTLDEFEAIRLADYIGFDHEEAAKEMAISRSTFSRLIEKARKKLSVMLLEGKVLAVEGGNIHFKENLIECLDCGKVFGADFEIKTSDCPTCHSKDLSNLAKKFGHGKCCEDKTKEQI